MKLLLIAGHGAGDPGAVGNGFQEATETRKVVAALAQALEGCCDVDTYPTSRNAYADYKAGQLNKMAQFSRYDYVLEIHFNAVKASTADGKTKGVECYVTTAEPSTAVEQAMVAAIAAVGLTNRGVKRNNWAVINQARKAGTSSALLEICFIDDPDDMAIYAANQSAIVEAIAMSIIDGFGLQRPELEQEETMTGKEIYDKLTEYTETLEVPAWAKEELEKAKVAGITDGSAPMQLIPRYQAALMAYRAYELAKGQK